MGKKGEEEEELNIEDGGAEEEQEEEEEGGDGEEDRGDNPNPEETTENLADVAGAGEEEEEEEDPAEGKKEGSGVVSHGRFHAVNESLKIERALRLKLEEENAQLRGSAPKAGAKEDGAAADEQKAEFDFDAKEEAYADALMEGDKKLAASIRREINAEIKRQAEESSTARVRQELETRAAQTEFTTAVNETLEKYPFLNAKAKDADKEAIAEVVELRDFYINSKGKTPADALRRAAEMVAKSKGVQAKQEGEPEEEEDAKEPTKDSKKIIELRRARILTRNAQAANSQPAKSGMAGVGNRATPPAVDVENMTEAEFEKLSEKEKKKARGDYA